MVNQTEETNCLPLVWRYGMCYTYIDLNNSDTVKATLMKIKGAGEYDLSQEQADMMMLS